MQSPCTSCACCAVSSLPKAITCLLFQASLTDHMLRRACISTLPCRLDRVQPSMQDKSSRTASDWPWSCKARAKHSRLLMGLCTVACQPVAARPQQQHPPLLHDNLTDTSTNCCTLQAGPCQAGAATLDMLLAYSILHCLATTNPTLLWTLSTWFTADQQQNAHVQLQTFTPKLLSPPKASHRQPSSHSCQCRGPLQKWNP
jgi:hypothetical protein